MKAKKLSFKNIGSNIITIGLNMKCRKVLCKSVLGHNGRNFTSMNRGITIKINNLDDYLLDTPENRKKLMA